jgi:hypothetical protein
MSLTLLKPDGYCRAYLDPAAYTGLRCGNLLVAPALRRYLLIAERDKEDRKSVV